MSLPLGELLLARQSVVVLHQITPLEGEVTLIISMQILV